MNRIMTDHDSHAEGTERGLGAWILLFGALAAGAGHGLFLYARLTRFQPIPNFGFLMKATGTTGTAVMVWFLLCVPLAALAFLLRRPLQRRRWLWPAALGAAIGSAGAFAFYARMMLLAAG